MADRLKVDYPAIITVPAPAIPDSASDRERQAIGDGEAIAALVMFLERHGACGGWSFDPDADTLRCCCGGLGFEVELLDAARTGAAA